MKRVLALDTSSWWGGVALVEGESGAAPRVVAQIGKQIPESHSTHLIDWIDQLLGGAGWPKSSLDAFVATRGPGSFTGIRIGLGTVRGLALAAERPGLGVSTLEALTEAHGPAEYDRVPIINAGRGEVYGARFDADSSPPRELRAPWLGESLEADGAIGSAVVFGGPGSEADARELAGTAPDLHTSWTPRSIAAAAGRLALLRGLQDPDGARRPAPLYIRRPDAELGRRRRA